MTPKKLTKAAVYVDGASRGNPGPAAAGVVLQNSEKTETIETLSIPLGTATNNIAEYAALVFALQEALVRGVRELEVFTDSELVAKQWSGEYKIKDPSLKVLYLFASQLKRGFKKVTVSHVPRESNKLADAAANKALNRGDLFA